MSITKTVHGFLSFLFLASCSSVSLVEQKSERNRKLAAVAESNYHQFLDQGCYLRDRDFSGESCFAAGTLVDTPKGPVKIESLVIGDDVYSYNTSSKRIEVSKVIGTSSHAAKMTCKLKMKTGLELTVTPNHEFYFPDSDEWQALSSRRNLLSERLLVMDIKKAERNTDGDSVQKISKDIPRNVYNIEVSKNHNYFVSGVLVHNKRD